MYFAPGGWELASSLSLASSHSWNSLDLPSVRSPAMCAMNPVLVLSLPCEPLARSDRTYRVTAANG
jgi:hypothetical protein